MGWDGKSAAGELNQIEAIERTTRQASLLYAIFGRLLGSWVY